MPDTITVRLTEEQYASLKRLAGALGKGIEPWAREILLAQLNKPVTKDRYAIRFFNDADSSRGLIRRFGDDPRQTSWGGDVADVAAGKATEKALELIRRNGPGDREEAIWELKNHFDNVFEIPV